MQPSGFDIWIVDFEDWHGGPYIHGVYAEKDRAINEGVRDAFREDKRNHGGSGRYVQTHRILPETSDELYFEGKGGGMATVKRYQII